MCDRAGADSVIAAERLQGYFREAARRQYQTESCDPFTLFFHPSDELVHLNYAIPDRIPGDEPLEGPLATLRAAFARRGRRARFEIVEAYAPDLPSRLQAHGFELESRPVLMGVVADRFRAAPPVAGVTIARLGVETPLPALVELLTLQRRCYGMEGTSTEADAEWLRGTLQASRLFEARADGRPVGLATLLPPSGGLAEVAGVGTLESHRRRGIGAALTSAAARAAFDEGADAVVLSAADERAARVYEGVGFRPIGHVPALIDRT